MALVNVIGACIILYVTSSNSLHMNLPLDYVAVSLNDTPDESEETEERRISAISSSDRENLATAVNHYKSCNRLPLNADSYLDGENSDANSRYRHLSVSSVSDNATNTDDAYSDHLRVTSPIEHDDQFSHSSLLS